MNPTRTIPPPAIHSGSAAMRIGQTTTVMRAATAALLLLLASPQAAKAIGVATPEEMNLNSEPLAKISDDLREQIALGELAGAAFQVYRCVSSVDWAKANLGSDGRPDPFLTDCPTPFLSQRRQAGVRRRRRLPGPRALSRLPGQHCRAAHEPGPFVTCFGLGPSQPHDPFISHVHMRTHTHIDQAAGGGRRHDAD